MPAGPKKVVFMTLGPARERSRSALRWFFAAQGLLGCGWGVFGPLRSLQRVQGAVYQLITCFFEITELHYALSGAYLHRYRGRRVVVGHKITTNRPPRAYKTLAARGRAGVQRVYIMQKIGRGAGSA